MADLFYYRPVGPWPVLTMLLIVAGVVLVLWWR